jgi:hypothetical protein
MNSESIAAVAQYRTSITTPARGRFGVADRQSPSRAELEASIRRAFGQHFGAEVRGFMPYLASYLSDEGRGVIGYRPAGDDPLYLESYLELPIESMLSRLTQTQVERHSVVEVGQFAADDVRVVGQLFAELVPFLREQGFLWICFTATHKIRHLLKRAGLTGLTIATAREDAVRGHADQWGSYYDNDPLVIVGNLEDPSGRWCAPLGNHGRMLAAFGD